MTGVWFCCTLNLFLSLSMAVGFQPISKHAVVFLGQQPWLSDLQSRVPGHLQPGLHFLPQLHRHLPGTARARRPRLSEQTGHTAGGKHLRLQAVQLHHHHPRERGLLLQAGRRGAGGRPASPSAAAVGDASLHELSVAAFLSVFPLSALLAPRHWRFLFVGRGLLWSRLTAGLGSPDQTDGVKARWGPATRSAGLPWQQTRQHHDHSRGL